MNPLDALIAILEYELQMLGGALFDSDWTSPMFDDEFVKKNAGVIAADLHAHPQIRHMGDFMSTYYNCDCNRVDLLAITTHLWSDDCMDYWSLKRIVELTGTSELYFADKGLMFEVSSKPKGRMLEGRTVKFAPAYECEVQVPGVKGKSHIVVAMPDRGFAEAARDGMPLDELVDAAKHYQGMLIGAHPFTLVDPWKVPVLGINIPFRLANKHDIAALKEELFPHLDCCDVVSSNCYWMTRSNDLLKKHYNGPMIACSDTHGVTNKTRGEIGRAGTVFYGNVLSAKGEDTRLCIKVKVDLKKFETYFAYTGNLQFYRSLVRKYPDRVALPLVKGH